MGGRRGERDLSPHKRARPVLVRLWCWIGSAFSGVHDEGGLDAAFLAVLGVVVDLHDLGRLPVREVDRFAHRNLRGGA